MATVRREMSEHHDYPAGVAQMRWHTPIHAYPSTESQPEECATGALVGRRLVLGSRGGAVVGVDIGTGSVAWSTPIRAVSTARLATTSRAAKSTSAAMTATCTPSSRSGERFAGRAKFKGGIEHSPEIAEHSLYLATAADRVFAVDPANGKMRWQYERDTPEGFTIHGNAAPRQRGGLVFAGFSDGYLVALQRRQRRLAWSRSLAAASDQFVDVDATPIIVGDKLLAASFSGGLYALRAKDGEVLWHTLIDGTSALAIGENESLRGIAARGSGRSQPTGEYPLAAGPARSRRPDQHRRDRPLPRVLRQPTGAVRHRS